MRHDGDIKSDISKCQTDLAERVLLQKTHRNHISFWVKDWNLYGLILEEDEILFLGLCTLMGMWVSFWEQKTNVA